MNYYELLEVREDSSPEVIEMAYKTLLCKYHPDIYEGNPEFSRDMTQKIIVAYQVLSNPERRAAHNNTLRIKRAFKERAHFRCDSSENNNDKRAERSNNEDCKIVEPAQSNSGKKLLIFLTVVSAVIIFALIYSALSDNPDSYQSQMSFANKIVYWTPGGEVYHYDKDCPSLARSDSVYSGTIGEAKNSGKNRKCKICSE